PSVIASMPTLKSLAPGGLRWRLTAWVAAVLLASIGVLFVIVYGQTGSKLRTQIDHDIAGDSGQLAQVVHSLRRSGRSQIEAATSRYVFSQPYSASSTLLFGLIAGKAVSNHPEIFGSSAPEPGETVSEQADENAGGRKLRAARIGYSTVEVPDVGQMRIHERSVPAGTLRITVGAAQPLAAVARAQRGIAKSFV